jgi:hypothetical protein
MASKKRSAPVVDESEFARRHNERIERRGDKDVFFIWIILMFISVVGAHFVLNFASASPTGYVTAAQDAVENVTLLVESLFVLFVALFIGLLGHVGILRR